MELIWNFIIGFGIGSVAILLIAALRRVIGTIPWDLRKLIVGFGAGIVAILLIVALSLVSGTILWALWPYAMAAFPGLVKTGTLAHELSWWTAVSLSVVSRILVKASQTNNK